MSGSDDVLGFDTYVPGNKVPVCGLVTNVLANRNIAPEPVTSDVSEYPRASHTRPVWERWGRANQPKKPHPDRDDPYNTNYRTGRRGEALPLGWNKADGHEMDDLYSMFGQTDEIMGGPTRLMNTPAARNPIMQLHGNIPRVRADIPSGDVPGEKDDRPLMGHYSEDPQQRAAQLHEQDMRALGAYNNALAYHSNIQGGHASIQSKVTPMQATFLSPSNVALLHREIEGRLSADQCMTVIVDPDDLFLNALSDHCQANRGVGLSQDNLIAMNEAFVMKEVRNYLPSTRSQERFRRHILEGNRPKYAPYGEQDKTHRGEVTLSTSNYYMSHPNNRYLDAYREQTGLADLKNQSSSACPWVPPNYKDGKLQPREEEPQFQLPPMNMQQDSMMPRPIDL